MASAVATTEPATAAVFTGNAACTQEQVAAAPDAVRSAQRALVDAGFD